jgi:hypothetical protein
MEEVENETQTLFIFDGNLRNLQCIVGIHVTKKYRIVATNLHWKLEI